MDYFSRVVQREIEDILLRASPEDDWSLRESQGGLFYITSNHGPIVKTNEAMAGIPSCGIPNKADAELLIWARRHLTTLLAELVSSRRSIKCLSDKIDGVQEALGDGGGPF